MTNSTKRRCSLCERAEDHTLDESGVRKVDLRPYGPGGADLCADCGLGPELLGRTTAVVIGRLLDAMAEGEVVITDDGITSKTSSG